MNRHSTYHEIEESDNAEKQPMDEWVVEVSKEENHNGSLEGIRSFLIQPRPIFDSTPVNIAAQATSITGSHQLNHDEERSPFRVFVPNL